MTKPDILYFGSFPDATVAELNRRYNVHHYATAPTAEEIPADVAQRVRGVATEANRGLSRAIIDRLPNLEAVSVFGVGLDLVDVAAIAARGIPLGNTPDIIGPEVADLAIGMMLASARQIVFADHYARSGQWAAKGPIPLGRSVAHKTCGVIGLGGIGRAIADRAVAFRMKVLYTGTREKKDAPYTFIPDVVDLARQSDFLMVACKGGPETRHLVSREVIDALGPQGTLINVARGTVVDEEALIDALANKRLGWAALDVFEKEPDFDKRLLDFPNVILQPHHGTAAIETRVEMGQLMLDNLAAGLEKRPLKTPVLT
ncbi:MAG: 2-hydroxyacid dehydrogenase [Pseudomonadota bacterium]